MSTTNIVILITIGLYLLMMIIIGGVFSKKNKNTDDFYLGGRKLGPIVTAMSAEASDMSSWLLMGLPAVALMTGIPEAFWTAIGLAAGTYLNWLFVAKRLRVYTSKVEAVTLPDFFSKRFGDQHHIITLVAALFIVIFFVPYTASGFAACGKLFSSLFDVSYSLEHHEALVTLKGLLDVLYKRSHLLFAFSFFFLDRIRTVVERKEQEVDHETQREDRGTATTQKLKRSTVHRFKDQCQRRQEQLVHY